MSLVQDDHVVQTFATDTPDEALRIGILPWTPRGDHAFLNPHMLYPLLKGSAIDAVPIAREIPRDLVPQEGGDDLLCRPLRRGTLGDVEVDDLPSVMGEDEQDEQHFVGHRRHNKEIQRHQILHVILQEGLPRR